MLLRAKVVIEGRRPLLWNRFAPEQMMADVGARAERQGTKGNNPTEWEKGVLVTQKRQLYLEPSYIFGCLRDAGRYTKSGRGSLQRPIAATLQVLSEKVLVNRFLPKSESLPTDPAAPVYLDVRMVRNPATSGRNVRYRVAARPDWQAEFEIAWDASIVSREQIAAVLNDAGTLVGLGDGRSIGFGRFSVIRFEVEQPADTGKKPRRKEKVR